MVSTSRSAADSLETFGGIAPLSNLEFSRFQTLIHREAGIFLNETKHALLSSRLQRRLRELGLKSFSDYYRKVVDGDPAEMVKMLDCIGVKLQIQPDPPAIVRTRDGQWRSPPAVLGVR